jgi:hypothetical protein
MNVPCNVSPTFFNAQQKNNKNPPSYFSLPFSPVHNPSPKQNTTKRNSFLSLLFLSLIISP